MRQVEAGPVLIERGHECSMHGGGGGHTGPSGTKGRGNKTMRVAGWVTVVASARLVPPWSSCEWHVTRRWVDRTLERWTNSTSFEILSVCLCVNLLDVNLCAGQLPVRAAATPATYSAMEQGVAAYASRSFARAWSRAEDSSVGGKEGTVRQAGGRRKRGHSALGTGSLRLYIG